MGVSCVAAGMEDGGKVSVHADRKVIKTRDKRCDVMTKICDAKTRKKWRQDKYDVKEMWRQDTSLRQIWA